MLAAGTDYAAAYPTYRGRRPARRGHPAVDRGGRQGLRATLRAAHVADHRELFDRVRLDLGQRMPDIPTDDLLRGLPRRGPRRRDRALEALFFQYGRYLLIASSRPGSLPANLQGVWNNSTTPPWSADYHLNINLQMNYWPAETTNLAETTAPLFDYVDSLRAARPGHRAADVRQPRLGRAQRDQPVRLHRRARLGDRVLVPRGRRLAGPALYEHYLFTARQDVPARAGLPDDEGRSPSSGWTSCVTDPRDGKLVVTPELLARARPVHRRRLDVAADRVGPVHQHARGRQRRSATTRRSRRRSRSALDRLDPGLRVGSWGQLQEWKADRDNPTNDHRHVSHLFALHPAGRSRRGRPRAGRRGEGVARPRAATAAPAGARPGRSTSGPGCSTATTPT